MSFNMITALCILGCDVLLYALFHWMYPDRRPKRSHPRRSPAQAAGDYPAIHGVPKYR
jgi:hypothetical protein